MKKFIPLLLISLLLIGSAVPARAEAETIRVGWVLRDKMTEEHNGTYSGYSYDYLMEISRFTDWSYEFVTGSLEELTESLNRGDIDILSTMLYTEERADLIDFADLPFGHKYTILFTQEESPLNSYDFGAFSGISVGVLSSDPESAEHLAEFAQSCGFTYSLKEYSDLDKLSEAIAAGNVDAGITDGIIFSSGIKILAEFSPIPYYYAVSPKRPEVLNELNRALWRINVDCPYIERELYDKYFGITFERELTERELAIIAQSRINPIKVGVIPSSEPACFWDETSGRFQGIFMEILRAVSSKTGLEFSYVPIDLSRGAPIAQIKEGTLTLAAGVLKSQTFIDDSSLSLSEVLLSDSLVMVGRKHDDFTTEPERRVIAAVDNFQVSLEYISRTFPLHRVQTYANADECLRAVSEGRADAAIYTRTCSNYLLHNPHYEDLETIPAYYFDIDSCVAGLSETSKELIRIIDKGLLMLSDSERGSIIMNTTLMNPYKLSTNDMLYKYRLPLLIILLLFFAVIAVLSALIVTRRVSEKKLTVAFENERSAHEQEKTALSLAEAASAAKGIFLSRMSHEIRTPLNAIIGYNTLAERELRENSADPSGVLDCLQKSDIASKHLLSIINDVLDMSAIESGKITIVSERFDFRSLISQLTALFRTQAEEAGIHFEVSFAELPEEWLIGDRMRVNQILANILSNAVKFTPAGGSVRLVVHTATEAEEVRLTFEVIDTGIGMSEQYLEHLFTPFEQADSSISRRYGGTGLGLSITKTLVDLMKGTIAVESSPGFGSKFTIALTFGKAQPPAHPFKSELGVLIIMQNEAEREYSSKLFSSLELRAEAVDCPQALSKLISAKSGSYALCLFSADELEECRELIAQIKDLPDPPELALAAYDLSEVMPKAQSLGISHFVEKPLFPSSVCELVEQLSGTLKQKAEGLTSPDFGGARVLLVEDNAMNMEIARRILERAGLTVDCAVNGREGVEKFVKSPPSTYKAILMDIQMPVLDGHSAARAIRGGTHPEAQSIPIIAMTADAFAENVAEAKASGMNAHISKPIDVNVLMSTLAAYIK